MRARKALFLIIMWNILLKALVLYTKTAKATKILKVIKTMEKVAKGVKKVKQVADYSNLEGSLNNLLKGAGYKSPQELFNKLTKNPVKLAEELGKLKGEAKDAFKQFAEETRQGGIDASALSSSWLTWGEYEPMSPDGTTGNLTLTTKTGRSYTYFSVSQRIWEAMKSAKGRNGTGAGSVFWKMYLNGYFASPSMQKMALAFKLAGIKPSKNDIKMGAKE